MYDWMCLMKNKQEIVENWLLCYIGVLLEQFGLYVLLINFVGYLYMFFQFIGVLVQGLDWLMVSVISDGIMLINFGMGSFNVVIIMDLLLVVMFKVVLFLGKCGGFKCKNQFGDLVLLIVVIWGEGMFSDYLLLEVLVLLVFVLQCVVFIMICDLGYDYWIGMVYIINCWVWEYDEVFKEKLCLMCCMVIDMEIVILFVVGFVNYILIGVLLLVFDQLMIFDGVKIEVFDVKVSFQFVENYIQIGIEVFKFIWCNGKLVCYLCFDE